MVDSGTKFTLQSEVERFLTEILIPLSSSFGYDQRKKKDLFNCPIDVRIPVETQLRLCILFFFSPEKVRFGTSITHLFSVGVKFFSLSLTYFLRPDGRNPLLYLYERCRAQVLKKKKTLRIVPWISSSFLQEGHNSFDVTPIKFFYSLQRLFAKSSKMPCDRTNSQTTIIPGRRKMFLHINTYFKGYQISVDEFWKRNLI